MPRTGRLFELNLPSKLTNRSALDLPSPLLLGDVRPAFMNNAAYDKRCAQAAAESCNPRNTPCQLTMPMGIFRSSMMGVHEYRRLIKISFATVNEPSLSMATIRVVITSLINIGAEPGKESEAITKQLTYLSRYSIRPIPCLRVTKQGDYLFLADINDM